MPTTTPSGEAGLHPQSRRADVYVTEGIESEIDACHQLSTGKRVLEVLLFASCYALGAAWCLTGPQHMALKLLGILPMVIAINSLGIFIHEGLHGLLAKRKAANHFFSFLCGLPLLISATAYRVTHNDHHFEFGRKLDYGTYRQHLDNRFFVWAAYYAQLFFGSILYVIFIPLLALRSADMSKRLWIVLEYCLIATVLTAFVQLTSIETILLLWLYPALAAMILTNIRGLASHALGDLDDIYLSSRTVTTPRMIQILFLHENYHLEHHLFPQVPSYNLKRVHQLVWQRLPRSLHSKSYISFLISFFRASTKLDLSPCGLVHPNKEADTL